MESNLSYDLAKSFLGKELEVIIDRPLGSTHPEYDMVYEVNYGFIPDTKAPDGEELDAYYLGLNGPAEKAKGTCIAIIHRLDNDDDKLVVAPPETVFSDEEIKTLTNFQEKYFQSIIIRKLI